MVAHFDFDLLLHPLRARIDAEVRLPSLSDDIECRAQLDAYFLVLRCVIYPVLADELETAIAGIQLRDPDAAGRERYTEPVLLVVTELEVDVHLLVRLSSEIAVSHGARIVIGGWRQPVVDEHFPR